MTKTVSLGEICVKIISGGTPSTEKPEFWGGSIPWITSADIKDHYTAIARKFLTEKAGVDVLPAGNILVVTRVGLGKLVVNQQPLAFSQDLQGLILKPNIDRNYLVYVLSQRVKRFKEISRGATIKGVTRDDLVKIKLPLPSLPRQRQIAAILDRADALRQKDRQLLEYYDQLAQSTFLALFGDPVNNEKGWVEEKMDSLLTFMTSGSRGWADYYSDSGSKFLRIQNVGRGRLKLDDLTYVNPPNTAEAKRTKVQAGDVLLSITADLGRTAVIPENFGDTFINQHLALLRFPKTLNPVFISALLTTDYGQRQIGKADKGGVKAGLNFDDIKNVLLLLPPLPLQQHFATLIERIEQQKAVVRQQMAASEALFQRLLQDNFGD